jgi:uncharacterized protein DUF6350
VTHDVTSRRAGGGAAAADRPGGARPLAVTGIIAAAWCVGIGLAVLTTVTLIGWIAAPRTALGAGLPGVFRTAVNFWLVAHHAGFSLPDGRVGMLPLGLTLLPGAVLYRGGGWLIRAAEVRGRKRVGVLRVALALAAPYAIFAGLLALIARSPVVTPSVWQSLLACLLLAMVAGGLGAARALVSEPGARVRSGLGALLRLLPDRPRSLVVGVVGATAVLIAAGAALVAVSLMVHLSSATQLYDTLGPGIVGGLLLFLIELAFLPNAAIWGMSYAIGPGFSVGAHTSVSPAGVFLGAVPAFPPFAALPEPGPAPLLSLFALAAPFLAGAVGGTLTVRTMPSPVYEAAPLWGFVSGALTGAVVAVLAALSGGPLGGGRLATMGPSPWQVGLLATLEVGVSAAIAAWASNWALLRAQPAGRVTRTKTPGAAVAAAAGPAAQPTPAPNADAVEFVEPDPVLGVRRPATRTGVAKRPESKDTPVDAPMDTQVDVAANPPTNPPANPPTEVPMDVPKPREPERVENRGGAIYVLRDEPPES